MCVCSLLLKSWLCAYPIKTETVKFKIIKYQVDKSFRSHYNISEVLTEYAFELIFFLFLTMCYSENFVQY